MRNTGIFADSYAQDTIEYVAMGLVAVLIGALILSILRPLITNKTNAIEAAWPS